MTVHARLFRYVISGQRISRREYENTRAEIESRVEITDTSFSGCRSVRYRYYVYVQVRVASEYTLIWFSRVYFHVKWNAVKLDIALGYESVFQISRYARYQMVRYSSDRYRRISTSDCGVKSSGFFEITFLGKISQIIYFVAQRPVETGSVL